MELLLVVAELLKVVGVALTSPEISGGKLTAVGTIASMGASLLSKGSATVDVMRAFTAQLQAIVSENREPTKEEWDVLKARSDAAHAVLQS